MALHQVGARTKGDVYQGMFFWYQAASLLIDSAKVTRVVLEHDAASGVDDIAVFYDQSGITDAGRRCTADFYQVKYHVDQRDAYCSHSLIDPSFIEAKTSLLQRFYNAFSQQQQQHHGWFRLHLVSNWPWKPDDALARQLREDDGALPDRFFTDSPNSTLGQIRETWHAHLDVDKTIFTDFAQRLRFGLNHFGRRWFWENVNNRLASVGLKRIPADKRSNPYCSLVQQFLMDGDNEFDRERLLALCRREELLAEENTMAPHSSIIGLRSFMRFAERIEDETQRFVCVVEHFEGRHVRAPGLWATKVVPAVCDFLDDPRLRQRQHHLLLECHSSLAFLAGYLLDRKSGAQVFPVPKGEARTVWIPSVPPPAAVAGWQWEIDRKEVSPTTQDIVVAISVTHDVRRDVDRYLAANDMALRLVLHVAPHGGAGSSSIQGADHAVGLAEQLMHQVRALRQEGGTGTAHIFAAAPNGFMFFLGRHRAALGSVQLYEFDFEGERGGSYRPSVVLPQDLETSTGGRGNPHGTLQ
jgi:hypothetical protein